MLGTQSVRGGGSECLAQQHLVPVCVHAGHFSHCTTPQISDVIWAWCQIIFIHFNVDYVMRNAGVSARMVHVSVILGKAHSKQSTGRQAGSDRRVVCHL